jgi:acetyl esterase
MALHPEVQALLQMVEESGLPPPNELSPEDAREQTSTLRDIVGPGPEVPNVEDFTIPVSAGSIGARRYAGEDPAGTVFWIHGGGWVICDLETHDAMCRLLALEAGAEVISIDYRRAPDHPFPAPLEDSWDALRWTAESACRGPLILAGDSAGGNMAAVCALRARDRGGPAIAQQVLVYPVTDCDFTTASYIEHGTPPDTFLTTEEMEYFWHHYIPDEAARVNPEASPLRAHDLSGLPPTIVVTAEYDPLRDEGIAYAEALKASGIEVTHYHYEDVVHAFFALPNLLQRGNEAIARVGADIRAAVVRASAPA